MAVKNITTKSGNTIKVEFERRVQDKVSYADGYNIVVGREIVERTNITLMDKSGKVLATGKEIGKLRPEIRGFRDAEMVAKGAVGKIGDAYIPQEVANQINAALAELDAENPKSDEQLEIERWQAVALARWEADAEWEAERAAFERKMDDPNSDL